MSCGSMSSSLLLMLGGASALAAPASVGPDSLYVVGCGVMGQSVCLQWRAAYPDATIIGETGSDASHERLRAIGVEPVLRSARDGRACDHVLFCAPPSPFGDDEYMLAVELRFTLTALHLQAVSTLRTLAVGGSRRPIYADRSRDAGYSSACSPSETGDTKPEP